MIKKLHLPRFALALLLAAASSSWVGCSSAGGDAAAKCSPLEATGFLSKTRQQLPATLRAVYEISSGSSHGKLYLIANDGSGRVAVRGGFGSSVSTIWWTGDKVVALARGRGCLVDGRRELKSLGLGGADPNDAVRVLAGMLPRGVPKFAGDCAFLVGRYRVELEGYPPKLRVSAVEAEGWRFELSRHVESVPRTVKVLSADGQVIVLKLVSLEWVDGLEVPEPAGLRWCREIP